MRNKKHLLVVSWFLMVVFLSLIYHQISARNLSVFAQSETHPTPTVSPTPASADVLSKLKQIELLKEKIATKVAQLRQEEKNVIAGSVKEITKNSITVTTKNGSAVISFSEDTVFYSLTDGKKAETAISKIKEGQSLAAFGFKAEDKSTLLAKFIYVKSPSTRIAGKIVDIDKSNFTITVKNREGNELIDIETYTKISSFSKEKGLVKSGFSKFKAGDFVHIKGNPNRQEKDRFSALRLIILPSFDPVVPLSTTLVPSPKK